MSTVLASSTTTRIHPNIGREIRIDDITDDARTNPAFDNHEKILRVSHPASALEAIIAIHNTALGPAMGGTRVWPYGSDDEALTDVLRLSRGMTLKAAMADVRCGGGKAVIIADPKTGKSEDLLRAYGKAVDRLAGRFITGEDVGLTVADADIIGSETEFLLGSTARGGDPAPATALGVYKGLLSAVRHRLGVDDLRGIHVAVQGLGNVGRNLVDLLARDGARLTVTDINDKTVLEIEKRYGATKVAPADIFAVEADVFAPCAMGGVISDDTLKQLQVAAIAGSANNQLLEPRHGALLHRAGILYAPDYVINGGGLIALSLELDGGRYTWSKAQARVTRIGEALDAIFDRAVADDLPPEIVADRIAADRIREASASTGEPS